MLQATDLSTEPVSCSQLGPALAGHRTLYGWATRRSTHRQLDLAQSPLSDPDRLGAELLLMFLSKRSDKSILGLDSPGTGPARRQGQARAGQSWAGMRCCPTGRRPRNSQPGTTLSRPSVKYVASLRCRSVECSTSCTEIPNLSFFDKGRLCFRTYISKCSHILCPAAHFL